MDISSVIFVGIYSINWFYYKSIHYRLQLRSFRRQHIRDFSSFMVKNKHLFDQFKGALETTLTVCLRTKYLNNDLFIAWNNAIRTFKNNEFFGIFWNNIRSPFKKKHKLCTTCQGLVANTVPSPTHLVERTRLCELLEAFPPAPCRVLPWNTTTSPGSHSHSRI